MDLPDKISNVVQFFSMLPGVGEKTATRQTLTLTSWSHEDLIKFGENLRALTELKNCRKCGLFSEDEFCSICESPKRVNAKTICVVESITDCLAIEKSGTYRGTYHILNGVLNPLLGIGPDELYLERLKERVVSEGVEEMIIALNPSVEGDATSSYIRDLVGDGVNVERIGFGIPIGGSLEYLDSMTIGKALENRKRM